MLGIGSGINCQMLAVEWQKSISDCGLRIADSPGQSEIRNPKSAIL
jgi:hypothetical protein